MKKAFSLVELSIVLVILGLLVGGVLAGQSLIRAAELRAVANEYQRFVTGVHTFRDKYFQLPGDMNNATRFWGAELAANCPGDQTTPSTTAATCNGNGDNSIGWGGSAGFGGESHRFWQHLANAGLIEGTYSGTHGAGGCNGDGSCNVTLGVNAPRSKLGSAGWSISIIGTIPAGHGYFFPGNHGNAFFYGTVANYTTWSALKPQEAWNVDTKADDGIAGSGVVTAWVPAYAPNCATSNNATATYQLSVSTVGCNLNFKSGY